MNKIKSSIIDNSNIGKSIKELKEIAKKIGLDRRVVSWAEGTFRSRIDKHFNAFLSAKDSQNVTRDIYNDNPMIGLKLTEYVKKNKEIKKRELALVVAIIQTYIEIESKIIERKDAPGLEHGFMIKLATLQAGCARIDNRGRVLDPYCKEIARVEPGKTVDLVALTRLPFARFIRWFVPCMYYRLYIDESPDHDVIRFYGGWRDLAIEIGGGSGHNIATHLRQALDAFKSLLFGRKREGLFAYRYRTPSRSKQPVIEFKAFGALRQDSLVRHDKRKKAPKLVPLPLSVPALIGRHNEHARFCAAQLFAMAHIRLDARKYYQHKSVAFDWDRIADSARIPRRAKQAMLDALTRGNDHEPALLIEHKQDAYRINDPAMERSIIEAGRRSRDGSRRRAKRKEK